MAAGAPDWKTFPDAAATCAFVGGALVGVRSRLSWLVSLRQREWNRAHSHKQKQIKSASDKMRFDGGVNLFFHWVLFV